MSNFEPIRQAIQEYSKSIAQDLADIRFFEVDKIQAIISAKMFFALKDCALMQSTSIEKRRSELLSEQSLSTTNGHRKMKINQELAVLKVKQKEQNQVYAKLTEQNEKYQFINWLKENGYGYVYEQYCVEARPEPTKSIKQIANEKK